MADELERARKREAKLVAVFSAIDARDDAQIALGDALVELRDLGVAQADLAEMTGLQMHAITLLRERVFVVEQKTTEVTEIDELDALQTTVHHWLEIDGRPAAVLRVLAHKEAIAIGRVATAHEHRGKGLAGRLMRLVLQDLAPLQRPVVLLGQSHLEQWYERLGFVRSGDEVLEVGIPHVPMTLSR